MKSLTDGSKEIDVTHYYPALTPAQVKARLAARRERAKQIKAQNATRGRT